MRIVISRNDLDELNHGSVVLDTSGIARTKIPGGEWVHGSKTPIKATMLADGRPMILIYDSGEPMTSLRMIRRHAELAQLIDPPSVSLLPYYDFAVCWNKRHQRRAQVRHLMAMTWTDVIEELAARVTLDIEEHLDLDEDTLGILCELRTWLLEQSPPGVKEDSDD